MASVREELANFLADPKPGKSTRPGNPQQVAAMAKVVLATLAGLPRHRAADLAGVSRVQIWRWLNPEDTEGPIYDRFRNAIARADGLFIKRELENIKIAARIPNMKTGQVDWKASAWLMEHRFQFDFGPKATLELTGPGGGPIQTEDKTLSDPEVAERLKQSLDVLREIGKVDVVVNGHAPLQVKEGQGS
jgi:hypothetical protein